MTALSLLLLLGSLLTIVQTDTSTGDTKFALELLRALARDKSRPNIVFSPSSIRTALALAYLGAEGVTGEELKQTLSLEGSDKNDVAQRFAHLLAQEENQSEDDAQFSYANRIYVAERYRLIQAYQELAGKYFNASAENVNFADNFKVSQQINSWVETKTHDQIKDLISADSLSSETAAVLINAIYFKGKWESPFSETMTATHDFTTRFGEKVKTSFMFQWQFFRHAELPSLKATALEMRYKGTDIVLLIILPLEEQGLYALEEKISVLDLNEISSQMREKHVRLQMPKFKLEFEVSLKPVLQELGIKTMFGHNADFSSLAKGRDIKISEVKHKAFMDVNENGTTAAASTYLVAVPYSGHKGQTIPFIVDHPFLFAIKDEQSIFFLGHVTRPSGNSSNYSSVLCLSPGSMTALSLLLLLGSLLSMVQADRSTGDTKFALKLFRVLVRDKSRPNIVFSPSSIRTALVLAYLGAEDTTAEELKQTLSLEGSDKNDVGQRFAHRLAQEQKQSGDDAQFSYANRIYVAERYRFIQAYQELAGKYLRASAENVNFGERMKVSQQINSWVAAKTHDQIKDLISADSLSSDTAAILINAIYFKAQWEHAFSESLTAVHDFASSDGKKVRTSFMFLWEFFRYAELPSLNATALEIRYKGTNIVLLIILPLEEQGLYALEKKLSDVDLHEISSQMRREHVQLQMPKFKLEFEVSLKPVLQQLGIKTMFDPNADFSSLVEGADMAISEVKHKAFIDVNENGTTAAASTYVEVMAKSVKLPNRKTYPFIVDHPFLFAIKDEHSTFFLGHVNRPYY
ncbi:uncharacterized protein LOC6595212 [Drosophila persimilis]|nr:uncharacterized protein LOC6595212 [Drosophila persimilis]